MKISASQIDLFNNCRLQWKFRYLDKRPEDDKFTYAATIFGTALHKVFECIFDDKDQSLRLEWTREELVPKAIMMFREVYQAETDKVKSGGTKVKLSRGETVSSLLADYTYRFQVGLNKVLDSGFYKDYKSFLTEERIEFTQGEFLVTAILDLVGINEDESFDVLDFKTGSRFDASDLHNNTQFIFYTAAGNHKFGRLPNRFRFIVYDRSKMRLTRYGSQPGDINAGVLQKFEDKLNVLRAGLQEKTFPKRDPQQKDMFCNFCGYKKACKAVENLE